MSLFISSINSGSNGNCYYVGNADEAVLIDVGITCREVERRMAALGLLIGKVKAIFVSHEHTDHVRGVDGLAKKYQLPVYLSADTYRHSGLKADRSRVFSIRTDEPVHIGALCVHPFIKYHDASDPHSFVVSSGRVNVGVFTDLGRVCNNLSYHFQRCHAAFLESNYDTGMLVRGRYPAFLKNRIRGGHGHLSNDEALGLYTGYRPAFMSHLILSHLSRENNCPQLVGNLFRQYRCDTEVIVASRYEQSPVFEIRAESSSSLQLENGPVRRSTGQLSLF